MTQNEPYVNIFLFLFPQRWSRTFWGDWCNDFVTLFSENFLQASCVFGLFISKFFFLLCQYLAVAALWFWRKVSRRKRYCLTPLSLIIILLLIFWEAARTRDFSQPACVCMAVSGNKTLGTMLAGTIQTACNVSTAKHIRGGKIIFGLGVHVSYWSWKFKVGV